MRILPESSAGAAAALSGAPPELPVSSARGAHRPDSLRQAYRGAFAVSLLSKVAGFARELLIAHTFGASAVANLYFTAVQIPMYVQSFFFGAFALPTVPVLRDLNARGAARPFRRRVLGGATAIIGVGALAGWLIMSATKASPLGIVEGALFLAPLFLCCLAVPAAGLVYCDLLARGDTTRASALPALMNVSAIMVLALGCWIFGSAPLVLSVSVAAGIAIQALIAFRRQPPIEDATDAPRVSTAGKQYRRGLGLAIVDNVSFSAAFFWQTQLYGLSAAGGTALFFYAYRLANFPFLLFVAPAQQLAYRQSGDGRASARKQRALVYCAIVVIGLGAAAALALLGPTVIPWIYQRGAMTAEASAAVASLAAPICLSLLAVSLAQTAGRYLSQEGGHGTYVAAVVPMYLAANLARLALAGTHPLATVALAGAAVELCAAAVLVTLTFKKASS